MEMKTSQPSPFPRKSYYKLKYLTQTQTQKQYFSTHQQDLRCHFWLASVHYMCILWNKFFLGRVLNAIWKMFKSICFFEVETRRCVQFSIAFSIAFNKFYISHLVFLEIFNQFIQF